MISDVRDNYIGIYVFQSSKMIFPFPPLFLCPQSVEIYAIFMFSAMKKGSISVSRNTGTPLYKIVTLNFEM